MILRPISRLAHHLLVVAILFSSAIIPSTNSFSPNNAYAQDVLPDAKQLIAISDSGFSPAEITVSAGTEIVWKNNSSTAVTLQSGTPSGGQKVFLPLIQRNSTVVENSGENSEATDPNAPLENAPLENAPLEAEFTATIAPGGEFSQIFSTAGSFPFYLSNAPQFTGRIIVNPVAATATPVPATATATVVPSPTPTVAVPTPTATKLPNQAPQLTAIGNRELALGSVITFTATAFDPDNDPIVFSADPLPLPINATLDAKTGKFSFRPEKAEAYVITFIVTDSKGNSDSETVTINVKSATPNAATTLRGRVLDTNDFVNGKTTAVVSATITLLDTGISTFTDATGYFTLNNVPAGAQILDIATHTAKNAPNGAPYAGFREGINLIVGVQNIVDRPFYLPRIAAESLTTVAPNETTVVNNTTLGIKLVVPPNTARAEDGSLFDGKLSISDVPENLAPAALPAELNPSILFTIQPVGVTFDQPVPLTFPNSENLPPGSETDIWSLDPELGAFVIVGKGKVSLDGKSITTIEGGVRAADWHLTLPPQPDPDDNDNNDNQDPDKCCDAASGSNTAVANGNLAIEHELVGYQSLGVNRSLNLVYNSGRADPRPIVSSDVTVPSRSAVPDRISARIALAGVQQPGEVFVNTSGLNESADETVHMSIQADATTLDTGIYPYRLTLSSHFNSASVSSVQAGRLLVYNGLNSAFGAGWGLDGLYRLNGVYGDDILMTDGNGGATLFNRRRAAGELLAATAEEGRPADPELPSANIGQTIAIFSDPPFFTTDTNIYFTTINDNGVQGTRPVRVTSVSETGNAALVVVPDDATTGNVWAEIGREARLQIVPSLTGYDNSNFGNGQTMYLYGSGFVEGDMTVQFGATNIVDTDPNAGINVYNANTNLSTVVPNNGSGGVVVVTDGGTSNPLVVGPTSFTAIVALAAIGTPANASQPSANNNQAITIRGTGLGENTNVIFPTKDDNGAVGSNAVRVSSVNATHTEAYVTVPDGAISGNVGIFGITNTVALQIVPVISRISNGDFNQSGTSRNMVLYGDGFVEGGSTIFYGATSVLDPDTGPNNVDVYYSGTQLSVIIPANAKGGIKVQTAGGTSNEFGAGPTQFTAINALASKGTPANAGIPSANARQLITVRGASLGSNSNIIFPTRNDNGVVGTTTVRVESVSPDGSLATVIVPDGAVTGDVSIFGATGTVRLQIVPSLDNFSISSFVGSGTSRNLVLYGHGMAEGITSVLFGAVTLSDPDTGPNNIDVYYSGSQMASIVPNNAGGLVKVSNSGGTSNALQVGPSSFTAVESIAARGVASNTAQSSANARQVISIRGTGITGSSVVIFPSLDDNGVAGTIAQRVDAVNSNGTLANVEVPDGATTGNITLFGTSGAIRLQIVPVLNSFANGDFRPSASTLTLYGSGFNEGVMTLDFGGALLVDPSTGSATVDVYYSGTQLNTAIPNNAKTTVTVKSAGGTSNPLPVGPLALSSISAVARLGTPANAGQPSANPGQMIQINGSNLTANSNVIFPSVDDNGVAGTIPVRVSEIGADNSWATVLVPNNATTGNITLSGATGSLALQIVPLLSGFNYGTFSAGNGVTLYGAGFVEGAGTVKFGGVSVVDPSTGSNTIDVYGSGTYQNVAIPASPGPAVQVTTVGGSSNIMHMTDPNVALLTPANAINVAVGVPVALLAYADDNSGVQYVDFLINGTVVMSDTSSPYEGSFTPSGTGAVTVEARARATDGGTSTQQVSVNAQSPTLAIAASALLGTPANAGQPSANVQQFITLSGIYFKDQTDIIFPTISQDGTTGTETIRVENVSPDRSKVTVRVPYNAQTGALQLAGTSASATLQVVPSINSFNNGSFNPSGLSRNLTLNGGGLIEGGIDVLFGDVTVSDPDTGVETIDVYYGNNTGLSTIIPDAAKGNVRVRSAGGTSNELIVAATSFTAILGVAARGTPASAGQPSANIAQRIILSGTNFTPNTMVRFTRSDSDGVLDNYSVRVADVGANGNWATVEVPVGATTGSVGVEGAPDVHDLQIVPTIDSFSNGDFAPSGESRNLTLQGGGFTEGGITVDYGTAQVVDPDTGYITLDVYSTGNSLNVIIPEGAGGTVTVQTAGGRSNALPIAATAFLGASAVAIQGTPANAALASANIDQFVTLSGTNFTLNTNVLFPTVDNEGVAGGNYQRVAGVNANGTIAWVQVPAGASSGNIQLFGTATTRPLQIVPSLLLFSNGDFRPVPEYRNMQLEGRGFIEGNTSVHYGDVTVTDLDTGSNVIDVWSSGRLLYSEIPENAKGLLTVSTDGGTSNPLAVSATAFTSLQATAQEGEAADLAVASANVNQLVTLRGTNFTNNTNVNFPTMDDSGVAADVWVRVHSVSADRTQATVFVPYGTTTGNVTVGGVAGSFALQIVPVISEFSYSSFVPGSTLFLRGSGFIEGDNRVRFGSTLVNDPDTGGNQVDSWNNGSYLYVAIPNGAQSRVRVSTIGGTSNVVEVDAPVAPTEYPTPKIVNSGGTRIFVAPDGSFSTLTENADKSFVMTTKNGIKHNFNAAGLQTSTVDRNGNTTSYGYDGSLRLTTITDPMGLVTSFVYANNRVSTITDPSGRVTKLAYDGAGNLTSITDPDNSVRYFGYNARHLMTAQTSKRGHITQYEYNFASMHVKSLWADGSTRIITPAMSIGLVNVLAGQGSAANPAPVTRPSDMIAQFQDGNGGVTSYKTDRYGAGTEVVDPSGRRVVTTRDADGNPLQTTQPNGALVRYTFDDKGNMLSLREGFGTALERGSAFEYSANFNLVTKITDSGGFVTTIDYDDKGNITKITDPTAGTKTFTYNGRGQLLTLTDELGRTTSFTYDAKGNPLTVTDPLGTISEMERNAAGEVTGLIQAKGNALQRKTTSVYDAMNRRTSMINAAGAVESYVYDAAGNLIESKLPTGETLKFEYDVLNRTSKSISPIQGTTQYFYDGSSNIVRMIDGMGASTFIRYDSLNRPLQITDPISGTLRFSYDVQDNLLSTEDARGKITRYEYDLLNRQTKATNPLLQSYSFTYDARDLLLTSLDAKGQTIKYSYDALSRRTKIESPDDVINFVYNAVGSLMSASDNDSKIEFSYDALDRPTVDRTVDMGVQPTTSITRTFDALGRRITLGDSAGGSTQYNYNNLDYLTSIQPSLGGAISALYDASGRPTKVTMASAAVTDYVYDANGRLQSITHNKASGGNILTNNFEYNAVSNVSKVIEGAIQKQYSYDPMQRLLTGGATTSPESYSYDVAGNRTTSFLSAAHTVDDANRLLEDAQFTYSYDANGNLASKTRKSDNAQTSYTFNAFGQLTGINGPNGLVVGYRYDAVGRRIEKNVGGQITRYIYDGAHIRLELNGSNQLAARFTHGNGVDEILAMERGGAIYYYLTDRLGSVRKVVNAAGTTVNSYEYDSYGRRTAAQETVANPFSYTGREYDAESGLYFYRARYYDSQTGRFISEDPIGLAGGDPNLYSYVRNNPANSIDPSGHFSFWDVLDVASFGMSLYDFIKCPGLGTGANLALDTIGLLPLIPGIGTVRRGLEAADALRHADDVGDALRHADDAGDALRHANDVPCSFTPDTLVTTIDGLTPIADIKVGDYVLAFDEETGKVDYYPVSAAMSKEDPVLIVLKIGDETIVTTPIHPFYTQKSIPGGDPGERHGGWTLAGDLQIGDMITSADGTVGLVQQVVTMHLPTNMHDLTVEDAHSFFVGEEQWLVHNCTVKPGTSGGDRAGKDFTPKGKQEVINENAAANGGQTKCEQCGVNTVPSQKSQSGVTPPANETQVDHIIPKSKGGDGSPSNGQVLCRHCNRQKSDN